ncbi:hypothetical protein Bca4012_026425 [Brassica carinata]
MLLRSMRLCSNMNECRFGECQFGECRFGECRFGECRLGECRFGVSQLGREWMPPKNTKVTSTMTTAQRAARCASRGESRATSLNRSCTEVEIELRDTPKGAPKKGQVLVDVSVLEELQMYREAYQGRMPGNGDPIGVGAVQPSMGNQAERRIGQDPATLNVVALEELQSNVNECRFGECRFGGCQFGECRFGECRLGECRFGVSQLGREW